MKKLLLLVFVLQIAASIAQAQYKRPNERNRKNTSVSGTPANLIKVNFLSPIASTGSFFYERALNERMSAQLGFQYTSYSGFFTNNERLRGIGLTPEFRYYFSDSEAPKGFFVAPFLRYRNYSLSGDIKLVNRQFEGEVSVTSIGGGVLVGGQWIFGEIFSLEAFIGPTISGQNFKATEGTSQKDYNIPNFFSPVWFRSGVTVGIAF